MFAFADIQRIGLKIISEIEIDDIYDEETEEWTLIDDVITTQLPSHLRCLPIRCSKGYFGFLVHTRVFNLCKSSTSSIDDGSTFGSNLRNQAE
ncbi:hypothetical protein ABEB36_015231 [Hypothenemus hampei]|uniref:Uncharacterized protein n=1 Tax=Hypothenemus hampei TaxID=57062 RepID=A0ABD1E0R5_HYPHA